MKILLAFTFALASMASFAGDRNTAYNVICKPMAFESDRSRCVAQIRNYNYFDDNALAICASFPFNNTKMECLSYIADKRYEAYEIDTCRNATFESEKLACLRDNGSNGGGAGCLPTYEVLNQLRSAQYELRNGNPGTVDKRLTYLISRFSNPNCQ